MGRTCFVLASWVVLSCALAADGVAQENEVPDGWLLAGGLGAGWSRVSCDVCVRSHDLGPAVYVRLGRHVRPNLLVGGEVVGWTHTAEDVREIVGVASAVGHLYPRPGGPLYLRGGLGWVTYRAEDDVVSNSAGIQLGAGFEFGVGGGFALSNYLHITASSFGSLRAGNSIVSDEVGVSLVQVGFGLVRR